MNKKQKLWYKLQGIDLDNVFLLHTGTYETGMVLCTSWTENERWCFVKRICSYDVSTDITFVFDNTVLKEDSYNGPTNFILLLEKIRQDPMLLITTENLETETFVQDPELIIDHVRIFDTRAKKKVDKITGKVLGQYLENQHIKKRI